MFIFYVNGVPVFFISYYILLTTFNNCYLGPLIIYRDLFIQSSSTSVLFLMKPSIFLLVYSFHVIIRPHTYPAFLECRHRVINRQHFDVQVTVHREKLL